MQAKESLNENNIIYQLAKDQHFANRQINLGYALVTFSHADEARQMNLALNGMNL